MGLRKAGQWAEWEGGNRNGTPGGLGPCPQLSQVPGPVLLVPEDCEASQECPLVGKHVCPNTG